MLKKTNILHWGIIAAAVGSFGVSFDAWWHISKGRDSFFVPPHLLIHLGVLALLIVSFYGWQKLKMNEWKKVFWWILLIPLSLPFDEIWHYFRGKESVESILLLWSPPHILLFIGAIGGLYTISHLIKQEKNMVSKEVYGSLLIASLLNVCFIILGPFFPYSPYVVAGYYGAGVAAFLVIYLFIHAHKVIPGPMPAVLVAVFAALMQMVFFDANVIFGSRGVGTYPHIPNWLLAMSMIVPAVIIDLLPKRKVWLEGMLAGLGMGLVLYWFTFLYIEPSNNPGNSQMAVGIISSVIGGLLAAFVHMKKNKQNEIS